MSEKDQFLKVDSDGKASWCTYPDTTCTISNNFKEILEKDFVTKEEIKNFITKEELDNRTISYNKYVASIVDFFNDRCDTIGNMIIEHMHGNPAYKHLHYRDKSHYNTKEGTSSMKKFIKKVFITIFTAIGIFSTVNYFASDWVTTVIENIKYTGESVWINIKGTDNIGKEWDSYSAEYKRRVFDTLNFHRKQDLIEYLNSGVNEKVKAFEESIK